VEVGGVYHEDVLVGPAGALPPRAAGGVWRVPWMCVVVTAVYRSAAAGRVGGGWRSGGETRAGRGDHVGVTICSR
jgi:hypothetical protein